MYRILSTFTWYANYHFAVNNGGRNKQKKFFQKVWYKTFNNDFVLKMSTFLYNIRTSIPCTRYAKYPATANNAEVARKYAIFQKF